MASRGGGKAFGVALIGGVLGGVCIGVALGTGGGKGQPRAAIAAPEPKVPAGAARRLPDEPYTWRNVEIVGGGFVTGIIFHPREKGLIYARTDIGGACRWDPKAKRWVPLNDWVGAGAEGNLLGIESVALDPNDPNRVYLAAGTYTNEWGGNGAILCSSDRGATWERVDMPFKMGGNEEGRSMGERLAVDPNDGRVLFFGSRAAGLWRSADRGKTWSKVESFPAVATSPAALAGEGQWRRPMGIGFVLFDATGGRKGQPTATLYAGVATREICLYRSRDGGNTWEAIPGQPQGFLPHHSVLASDGTLYVTYGNAAGPNGMTNGAVWKLDTKSGVWTDITPVKPGAPNAGNFGYAGLTVDAKRPGTVMVSTMDRWNPGDDIFRSTDGGKSWIGLRAKAVRDSSISPFLNWGRESAEFGHWIGDVEIDPYDPGHVLYVTGATIWGSEDADAADKGQPTHWTVRAQGLEETAVLHLVSPPEGPHLISGLGDIGGFRHDDLMVSPRAMWTNPTISTTDGLDFAEKAPNVVVRVGGGQSGKQGGYSTDGATTWAPFASEPAGSRGSGSVAVSADGKVILWAPRGGAPSWTRDHGAIWTACTGLPAAGGGDNGLSVVADRADPARFYAVAGGKFYGSADGGATFQETGTTLPEGRRRLRATPGRAGDLWMAAGDNGLYHSTDGGAHFEQIAEGVVQGAEVLGFGKAAPGKDYPALFLVGKVGGTYGVYRSDDGGASWTRINDDKHRYGWIGQAISGDPRIYGRVYLGTNGRGILYADPVLSTRR